MPKDEPVFDTVRLTAPFDTIAPDGSEIRVLGRVRGASMAHGTLAPGYVSLAVVHQTVDEIWFVMSGRAEIWRRQDRREEIVTASSGTSITIPVGTHFQFRTVGESPFQFIMCTVPAWPGDGEAVRVPDHWPV